MDLSKDIYLSHLLHQVIEEAKDIGIPVSPRIRSRVKINGRVRGRFGGCKKEKRGILSYYTIEISSFLLDEAKKENFSAERVFKIRQILAHEILHTCRGCGNHGERWKDYARRMNSAYGYDIKRVSTYEEMGLKAPDNEEDVRYVIICEKCGMQIPRRRNSKFVQYPHLYRCRCGGSFRRANHGNRGDDAPGSD
ncbi:MAG: hypothetical protein ACOX4U_04010 [Anaerovoracaceae bacterium]|jgi:predicted SprT family Zn-dependent metalloprotease